MKKLPPIWLALINAAAIEIAFVAIYILFGRISHGNPQNLLTVILLYIHIPGIEFLNWVRGHLFPEITVAPAMLLVIAATLVWMTALAYGVIRIFRRRGTRAKAESI
jgi:hypothetical protein